MSKAFEGWGKNESPAELFAAGDWLKCLHACMVCHASLLQDPQRAMLDLADDGLMCELVHLAAGMDIGWNNDLDTLADAVMCLEMAGEIAREDGVTT